MSKQTKAYLALIFICIVWGTTYLVIRIGVLHFPAFLFAGIRQLASGIIVLLAGYFNNKKIDLSRSNLLHQLLVGFMLITVGNGLVSWGEMHIPSGIAALICSLMPMIAVLFNLATNKNDHFNWWIGIGIFLGFTGVALIFKDDLHGFTNSKYLLGIIATFIATSSWAIGSIINKRKTNIINPLFNSGLQVCFGGILLFVFSPFMDNYANLNVFHKDVVYSLLYLIVFGSVLAYTAYMYALKELPVGIVTMYAYVNPLVAVVLGYFLLKEPFTIYTIISFICILSGVFYVNRGYKK